MLNIVRPNWNAFRPKWNAFSKPPLSKHGVVGLSGVGVNLYNCTNYRIGIEAPISVSELGFFCDEVSQ